jgi:HEPN domain-containing protein
MENIGAQGHSRTVVRCSVPYFQMDRKDLQSLSRVRLSEARSLLKAGLPDGAYYLAGYAVECGLKACIAKETQRYEFPEKNRVNASHTHDLKELVRIAELQSELREAGNNDPLFLKYWDIVQLWSEKGRYVTHSQERAQELIEAIGDRNHGVIKWLKHYW